MGGGREGLLRETTNLARLIALRNLLGAARPLLELRSLRGKGLNFAQNVLQ